MRRIRTNEGKGIGCTVFQAIVSMDAFIPRCCPGPKTAGPSLRGQMKRRPAEVSRKMSCLCRVRAYSLHAIASALGVDYEELNCLEMKSRFLFLFLCGFAYMIGCDRNPATPDSSYLPFFFPSRTDLTILPNRLSFRLLSA
jgi:hypothetical protein